MKPEFKLARKGYDMRQVDAYIDHIRSEHQRLVQLSENLYSKTQRLEAMLSIAGIPTGVNVKPEPPKEIELNLPLISEITPPIEQVKIEPIPKVVTEPVATVEAPPVVDMLQNDKVDSSSKIIPKAKSAKAKRKPVLKSE